MAGEAAGKKLYDAATKGDVATFKEVVQEDPYLLDVISLASSRNLLHIAIMQGHMNIVEEMLKINPLLARDVDSRKSSSLHIAAAQGHVEIAKKLLAVAPEMCWWLDDQGMNPVHVAVMSGQVEMLEELIRVDALPAMERVNRGQTVLHLSLKHRRLGVLKVLVDKLSDLVSTKDDDGDTILHLAVRSNQLEMIRYLAGSNKIEKDTTNSMGKTALDIFMNENPPTTATYWETKRALLTLSGNPSILFQFIPKFTDNAMVVVVLIATMAFQAAVSPPGGVWQGDTLSHVAGTAVMASSHPEPYKKFSRANTAAFISSVVTILFLTTELPSSSYLSQSIAMGGMWLSLIYIAVSYGASLIMTNPMVIQSVQHINTIVASVFLIISTLLAFNLYTLIMYLSWKRIKRQQRDLTTAPLITRGFFRIFELFEGSPENMIHRLVLKFRRSDSPLPAA